MIDSINQIWFTQLVLEAVKMHVDTRFTHRHKVWHGPFYLCGRAMTGEGEEEGDTMTRTRTAGTGGGRQSAGGWGGAQEGREAST